jgi:hypothetical protein
MTITQAHNINTLCTFLLGPMDDYEVSKTTEAEARKALAELADQASKALSAGWDGVYVQQRWRKNVKGAAGRFAGGRA